MTTAIRTLVMCAAVLRVVPSSVSNAAAQQPADSVGQSWEYDSQLLRYRVEVVATGVHVPWGLAFLHNGRALVSDRAVGQLSLLDIHTGVLTRVAGVPAVYDSVDAGLLDVAVHPDYARNGWIYYAYASMTDSGSTTVVERARLRDTRLVDRQRLFLAYPAVSSSHHFGSRLVLQKGYLFITLGERDIRELAQELWTDHGKVIRLYDDGRVPRDNPFVGRPGARPEVWSYGHRNPHGLTLHPQTGELWETEHGPLGGDEINIIRPGLNYGWPIVTYGREYDGGLVGDGLTQREGMEQPVYHYATSAALSGLTFYTGGAFPQWRGNLFVGAMAPRYLGRLILENGRVVREERLLGEKRWRVRVVQQGPDGLLYLGIEEGRDGFGGMIVRLRPADGSTR